LGIGALFMVNVLKDHTMEAQSDILGTATKAMSALAQAILMNMLTGSHPSKSTRAASQRALMKAGTKPNSSSDQFISLS